MKAHAHIAFGASLLALACAGCMSDTRKQERQRIQALQQQWVEAIAEGDVATIVGFYAEDAWFLPPGSEPLHDRERIRAWWERTLADPPWESLTFGPREIGFAEGGDLAYDVGTSTSTVAAQDGEKVRQGKYLVVWRLIDGEWKVVADAFNGD